MPEAIPRGGVILALMDWAFIVGPLLLMGALCGVKYLQNRGVGLVPENFFCGTELSLSGLGSLLGAFSSASGTVDAWQVLTLGALGVLDVCALGTVTILHRE